MEDKIMQRSFTFRISDKITAQTKKSVTCNTRKVWQVKEMEEDYEH